MREELVIENKQERERLVRRVEVLEKVKSVLLIPGTDFATVKQVAGFYEVGEEAIQSLYKDNKAELDSDGVVLKKYKEFINVLEGQLKTGRGKTTVTLEDATQITIPMRGVKVFPRRAILRVGMLLRDSEIAKEVRSQLLNIEERTSDEVKIHDINEEERLLLNITLAYKSGNIDRLMNATTAYNNFQTRYIKELEDKANAYDEIVKNNSSVTTMISQKMKNIKVSENWNKDIKNLKLGNSTLSVLVFIHDFINVNGFSPTIREICTGTGLKSTSSVSSHIEKLNDNGFLVKDFDKPRSIRVNEEKYVEVIR